jgi:metal-responsive CopG/Arc/MetJ family transcriptional regulator
MPAGEDKQFRWSQSIPEDWLPYLDEVATKQNKTRVGFVRDLIRESIPTKYRTKLSEPQTAGRPAKEPKE